MITNKLIGPFTLHVNVGQNNQQYPTVQVWLTDDHTTYRIVWKWPFPISCHNQMAEAFEAAEAWVEEFWKMQALVAGVDKQWLSNWGIQ